MLVIIFVETSFVSSLPLLKYIAALVLVFSTVMLALSLVNFAVIMSLNANLAIKGKSSLSQWRNFNYVLRLLIVVLTASNISLFLAKAEQLYRVALTEPQYLEQVEHLYSAGGVKPECLGEILVYDDFQTFIESNRLITDHLKVNNGYFELMPLGVIRIPSVHQRCFFVLGSKEYIDLFCSEAISEQLGDSGNYILIPVHLDGSSEAVLHALNELYPVNLPENQWSIIYYSDIPGIITPFGFIEVGVNNPGYIIVVMAGQTGEFSSQSFFFFTGTQEQAQAYYDDLASSHSLTPVYFIESVESQYRYNKGIMYGELQVSIPVFIAIIMAILANASQLTALDTEVNSRRHSIEKSEGKTVFELIKEPTALLMITLLTAALLISIIEQVYLKELATVLGFCFLIEAMVIIGVTSIMTRDFASRLR